MGRKKRDQEREERKRGAGEGRGTKRDEGENGRVEEAVKSEFWRISDL